MTDQDVHNARAQAGHLLSYIKAALSAIEAHTDELNRARAPLKESSVDGHYMRSIVRTSVRCEQDLRRARNKIADSLNDWPIPEMPPLDLENLPDVVFYNPDHSEQGRDKPLSLAN